MEFWQIPPAPSHIISSCLFWAPVFSSTPGIGLGLFTHGVLNYSAVSSQQAALGVSGRTDISGLDAGWATGAQTLESLLDSWELNRIGGKDRGCPSTEATSH